MKIKYIRLDSFAAHYLRNKEHYDNIVLQPSNNIEAFWRAHYDACAICQEGTRITNLHIKDSAPKTKVYTPEQKAILKAKAVSNGM